MAKGGNMIYALLLMFAAVFFCIQPSQAQPAMPAVVINEIAWMGTASSSNNEWLELYNPSEADIDLSGWVLAALDGQPNIVLTGSLKAREYFLLERTSDATVSDYPADLIYTGSLGNAGEFLELKNGEGSVIDSLDASGGWPGGDNTTKATLERTVEFSWQTSSQFGGTPRATNSVPVVIVVVPPSTDSSSTVPVIQESITSTAVNTTPIAIPDRIAAGPGEVVINELVSDPLDNETEWVELYLVADKDVDLSGWTLEDGSKAQTKVAVRLSRSRRFAVIEAPKGALNNTGDIVVLRDGAGGIIDQVAYGAWQSGRYNAPVARDGNSLARYFDGVNTYSSAHDWAVTETPTKEASNRIAPPGEEQGAVKAVNVKDLVINELLPDPTGRDELGEFVEIYNQGDEPLALGGWRLQLKSGQIYRFAATSTIGAHETKAYWREQTRLALPNDSGSAKLLPPNSDRASFSVSYRSGKPGQSYIKDLGGQWHWTESPTPGSVNRLSAANQPPVGSFYVKTPVAVGESAVFDSSDTVDPEGDALVFNWQFGDGATSSEASPEHVYLKKGSFKVKLSVSDGRGKSLAEQLVKVVALDQASQSAPAGAGSMGRVLINEVMPNPEGADEAGEWIEFYNPTSQAMNLFGWVLDDGPNGSDPYRINEEVSIEPYGFFLFERSETDLALNNNADEVRLSNAAGLQVDKTAYKQASEGMAWARKPDGGFAWTEQVTPNEVNVIREQAAQSKAKAKKANKKTVTADKEVGDEVVMECVVTSLPGQLASQYFYCQNDRGWQVYNYKKDFPPLGFNDKLEVRGIVQKSSGNWRLKIRDRQSIKKVGQGEPVAQAVALDNLSDAMAGLLVTATGELTKKSGSGFYLDDDSGEALVYLKNTTGLRTGNYQDGERLAVIGIVQLSQTGLKILPRQATDVKRQREELIIGQVATASEIWLGKPGRARGYAIAVGSGMVLAVGLWVMKRAGVKF